MKPAIQLVVFDVGGVFVRTGRTWPEDAALAGFHFDHAWIQEFNERRRGFPSLTRGELPSGEYFQLLASASEGVLTAEDIERITRASLIEEYPLVGSVFDALDERPVDTALLTNCNEIEWTSYFPESGESLFPTVARARHRFASHLIGAAKPDRRIYEHVERNTGYAGNQILFLDDRQENVAAARDLGWRGEVIDHQRDTASQVLAILRRYEVI